MGQQFETLRAKWIEQLRGSDRNSVERQLQRVSWDLAAFETVEDCVSLAPAAGEGFVQLNGMVVLLIRRLFAERMQVSARRLNDKGNNKHTISLGKIVVGMKANVHLLTRKHLMKSYENALSGYSEEEKADLSAIREEVIDRLTRTSASKRLSKDRICVQVFDHLLEKLDLQSRKIKKFVDKFVAHSEGPGDSSRAAVESTPISYLELRRCHQTCCETLGFLLTEVLGDTAASTLPYPQFDQFKNLDRPLANTADIPKLQIRWVQLQDEVSKWSDWGMDDFAREFGWV